MKTNIVIYCTDGELIIMPEETIEKIVIAKVDYEGIAIKQKIVKTIYESSEQ